MDTLNPASLVIFSDVDGTLLEHGSYSFDAAKPALERLAALDVPVVLATSKTAAEVIPLRRALHLEAWPAMVENGAGLLPPDGETMSDADEPSYERLRAVLDALPIGQRRSFKGFGDMAADEVARATDLPIAEARHAKERQFSEPGLWTGVEDGLKRMVARLLEEGVTTVRGGRFLTLSFGADKARRMAEVLAYIAGARGVAPDTLTTLALGDGENDIAMLEAADRGIIIPNPAHAPLPMLDAEEAGTVTRAKKAGPAGWNETLQELLGTED